MQPIVKNFRMLPGTKGRIFRSAHTDELAQASKLQVSAQDQFILRNITMVLDLRAAFERAESVEHWTQAAPGNCFETIHVKENVAIPDMPDHLGRRCVVYLNFTDKITHRLPPDMDLNRTSQRATGLERLIQFIDDFGLLGLYKLLLDQHVAIVHSLKLITLHLLAHDENKVLIHCVQGKDRTGILAMLLQSIIGVDDEVILRDYGESHNKAPMLKNENLVLWWKDFKNRNVFEGAPVEVMRDVLSYLRKQHGSVANYLDSIGFAYEWQDRLRCAVLRSGPSSRL